MALPELDMKKPNIPLGAVARLAWLKGTEQDRDDSCIPLPLAMTVANKGRGPLATFKQSAMNTQGRATRVLQNPDVTPSLSIGKIEDGYMAENNLQVKGASGRTPNASLLPFQISEAQKMGLLVLEKNTGAQDWPVGFFTFSAHRGKAKNRRSPKRRPGHPGP